MTDTAISWTHRPGTRGRTWNPTNGCEVISPGCANCYAMRLAGRFCAPGQRYHGLVTIAKNKRAIWTGESRFEQHMLDLPLRWRDPSTVFVNSMSDLFYEGFSNEQIAAVFGVMAASRRHTFQVLTKRARRMREWFEWLRSMVDPYPAGALDLLDDEATAALAGHYDCCHLNLMASCTWPLPNVWLGVSVENQAAADERIPELLATPAAVRFLSCEPLLGHLDLQCWIAGSFDCTDCGQRVKADEDGCCSYCGEDCKLNWPLDWIIAGCESGPSARLCDVAWLRSLRDQCAAARLPFFAKQARPRDGEYTITDIRPTPIVDGRIGELIPVIAAGPGSERKGGGVIELPYLDGVQHAAFPEVPR